MKTIRALALTLLLTLPTAAEHSPNSAWFREAGFGVFVHYLGGGPGWNERVDSFAVEAFADQIASTGARYVMFTLGQNSGYYCSPNAAYEKYAGYKTGERCSRRDLPMEIGRALARRGIRLMLYLPSRSPQEDSQAMTGLGDVNERQPAPQEFTGKWSDVIREWSARYGELVAGWWFDGAYNTAGWDDLSLPYNWNTWAAAARAGNPDGMLAFNRGVRVEEAFIRQSAQQDYTAGEQSEFVQRPAANPAPEGMVWHVLSHLGSSWGKADGPRESNGYMAGYVRSIRDAGGVVSIDANVSRDGRIYQPHLEQLAAIGKAMSSQ
jgi:hypothetical protein